MKIEKFIKSAPIVPGESMAGIPLGTSIADIADLIEKVCIGEKSFLMLTPLKIQYLLGNSVFVSICLKLGCVESIGVSSGYTGLLEGKIGIGSTLSEAEKILGALEWNRKDPGYWPEDYDGLELCIESNEDILLTNPNVPIAGIRIHRTV